MAGKQKYESLIALQNGVAKNSWWRSAAINTPISGSFATARNKDKVPMPMPSYKRPHGIIGQSSHGSHGSFGGNENKGASNSKGARDMLRMQKQALKFLLSLIFLTKM